MTTWELEAVYDEQIAPLMTQIINVCQAHDMPMFASFAYGRNEEQTDFCTTKIGSAERAVPELTAALRCVKENRRLAAFAITTKEGEGGS